VVETEEVQAPVVATAEPEPEVSDSAETAEDASDAQLRQWAKDNNIEGVPASGRLSSSWREQITNSMISSLDPKEEDSAEDTSSTETSSLTTEEETASSTTEGEAVEEPEVPVQPEFETGTYRSVFKAPDTFVSGQAYTA
jgi:hypothetical protein